MADERHINYYPDSATPPWWQTLDKDPWYVTGGKILLGEQEVEGMRRGEILPWVNAVSPLLFMGKGGKGPEMRVPDLPPTAPLPKPPIGQGKPIIAFGDPFSPPVALPPPTPGRQVIPGSDVADLIRGVTPRPYAGLPELPPPSAPTQLPPTRVSEPFDWQSLPTGSRFAPPPTEPPIKITAEEAMEAHNKFIEKLGEYIAAGKYPTDADLPGLYKQSLPTPAQPPAQPPAEKPKLSPYDESPAAELERILYWGNYRPGGKPYYPYSPEDMQTISNLGLKTPQRTPAEVQQDWLNYVKKYVAPGGDGYQQPGGLFFKTHQPPIYPGDFPYDPGLPPGQPGPARFMPPGPKPTPPPGFDFSQFGYVYPQMPIRPQPDWYQQMWNSQLRPGDYISQMA